MAKAGAAAKTKAGEVSKEQASAWLRTVLHPIARAAKITRERLTSGSYSFRAHLRDFEFLRSSDAVVSPVYELNFRHMRKHLKDVDKLVRDYDTRLTALREACRDEFDWLLVQPTVVELGSAAGEGSAARYLAEYAVNNLRELTSAHKLQTYWAEHGDAILALRSAGVGAPKLAAVKNAADALLKSADKLADRLDSVILDLADQHGLPPVDPDARVI